MAQAAEATDKGLDMDDNSTANAMKHLVPIINKLRDAFVVMKDSPIDLPRKLSMCVYSLKI
jgi:hypothetical protein